MLEVRGIDIAYGAFAVLHKVDIAVGERRIVGLFGHNGAGKSSLLKGIYGMLPVRAGQVTFAGEETTNDRPFQQAARGMRLVPQEGNVSIDVLHNNVGGQGTGRSLKSITVADWNATLARNLTSAMLSCRAVVPIMEAQGGGSIVNVSSISSLRHLNVPTAVYAAAKGGLNEFSKNIALQHASKGVRVNCVLPGYIDTPFIRRKIGGRPNYEIKGFKSAEEYSAARNEVIPMRRMGTGWDVAYA